ncbi:MAG: alpha/beta hydrolase [Verrucomicrobia bacterium]|nr:alpha/beta hydrolase [Verrucomicrobiota bacterium]
MSVANRRAVGRRQRQVHLAWQSHSMRIFRTNRAVLRITAILFLGYLALVAIVYFRQRAMLYFPTHSGLSSVLAPWLDGHRTIGYCREVPNPRTIWLMMHGNAGQAADRDYVLQRMSEKDSLYVLEYPGYGSREGSPCLQSINQAASEGYRLLRARNPNTPVCVLGESLGSGSACALAQEKTPPDKILLVVPFDSLANVASGHFPFLPVRLMLRDTWNNVESLRHYAGPVVIFGAVGDTIIPMSHAQALANQIPKAQFIPIAGGHNDWSQDAKVKIER